MRMAARAASFLERVADAIPRVYARRQKLVRPFTCYLAATERRALGERALKP
jgi:hypothetical protein